MSDSSYSGYLVDAVHGAEIRCLDEVDRCRLALVRKADTGGCDRGFERLRIDLAVRAGDGDHLRSAAKEARRVALRRVDVRIGAAVHGAERCARGSERQRVGRGAGWNRKDADGLFEEIAESLLQSCGQRIAAVTKIGSGVGGSERGDQLGRRATGVVAAEIDGGGKGHGWHDRFVRMRHSWNGVARWNRQSPRSVRHGIRLHNTVPPRLNTATLGSRHGVS